MKITKTEKYAFVGIVVCLLVMILCVWSAIGTVREHEEKQEQENRTAYDAWVKVTKNPRKLTYAEWKALSDKELLPREDSNETE